MAERKRYDGRVPACGVFCGKCPVHIRDKNPCTGAGPNPGKCERCKSLHLCCRDRGITHCFECRTFPCYRFRTFAKGWEKYGQDLIANQERLRNSGIIAFLEYYNNKT